MNLLKWIKSQIHRHERCLGILIHKSKRHHIELWFCPPNYEIKEHAHVKQDIELVFLCGNAVFHRNRNGKCVTKLVTGKDFGTHFTIKAGDNHYFTVSNRMLVFLNIATFEVGQTPISAAEDFILKEKE